MNITRKELLHKLKNAQPPKVFLSPPHHPPASHNNHVVTSLQPRLRSRTDHDVGNGASGERAEFERQMASLQERQWAAAYYKSNLSHKKTKKCTKRGKLSSSVDVPGTNNAHSPVGGDASANSPFAFQPASFSVDKSTQDLLQEAMHQMVHMTGVGISAVEKTPIRSNKTVTDAYEDYSFDQNQEQQFLPTMVNAQSAVASTSPPSTQQEKQQASGHYQLLQPPGRNNSISNNPFSALETGDSDDEGGVGIGNGWSQASKLAIQQPSMSFAPASFSLMPTQTPTPASTPTAPGHPHNRTKYGGAGGSAVGSGGGSSLALALGAAAGPPPNHQHVHQHASGLFGNNLHVPSIAVNEEDDNVDPDL